MSNIQPMGGTELMRDRINTLPHSLLKRFQIIHSRVRNIEADKKKILVLHDLAQDPEAAHLANGGWKKFDKLVFVSHWQQSQYNTVLGVPYSAGVVINNAIPSFPRQAKTRTYEENRRIRLIYTSTPHRGLELLSPVFDEISRVHPDAELKVFSSFGLYGWEQRDAPYQPLFDKMIAHPKIVYSKAVPNEVIRQELEQADIFAYPSIWPETSCLCLIEAMCAGLFCVHSSLGALPETSMGLTSMYGYTENHQDHAQRLYDMLMTTIGDVKNGFTPMQYDVDQARAMFDWDYVRDDWVSLLSSLS